MNVRNAIVLAILVNSPIAIGADSTERSSPLDDNPQCMDRENKECIVKDDGTRRRIHLSNRVPANVNESSPPSLAAPKMEHSGTSQ